VSYTIRKAGAAVLHRPAQPITEYGSHERAMVRQLWDTLYVAKGWGLAGPQIGYACRVCVVQAGGWAAELLNPALLAQHGWRSETEGCLSIPGQRRLVWRAEQVTVEWHDQLGGLHQKTFGGLVARVIQHELDHLEGILITDKGA
jgi:peptide deformylase